ncbi:MAG: DivIVA domain-containing protein, partial [Peptococcaceae bacterium]|nr:DivIVA domain-containing protein [Peptococcaceae bacterium]
MLTPLDIHNKVFSRAFRGYKMEEVDAFLDEIIRDYESYFRENNELRDKIALLEEEVSKGREISATLEKTIVLAQRVHDDEAARAKKESDFIIMEAENKGTRIIQDAENEVLSFRQRIEQLRLFEKQLYLKHKGFLEFQMELLDGYKDKETLLSDSDMDKLVHGGHERDLIEENVAAGQTIPDVVSIDEAGGSGGAEDSATLVPDKALVADTENTESGIGVSAYMTESPEDTTPTSAALAEQDKAGDKEAMAGWEEGAKPGVGALEYIDAADGAGATGVDTGASIPDRGAEAIYGEEIAADGADKAYKADGAYGIDAAYEAGRVDGSYVAGVGGSDAANGLNAVNATDMSYGTNVGSVDGLNGMNADRSYVAYNADRSDATGVGGSDMLDMASGMNTGRSDRVEGFVEDSVTGLGALSDYSRAQDIGNGVAKDMTQPADGVESPFVVH